MRASNFLGSLTVAFGTATTMEFLYIQESTRHLPADQRGSFGERAWEVLSIAFERFCAGNMRGILGAIDRSLMVSSARFAQSAEAQKLAAEEEKKVQEPTYYVDLTERIKGSGALLFLSAENGIFPLFAGPMGNLFNVEARELFIDRGGAFSPNVMPVKEEDENFYLRNVYIVGTDYPQQKFEKLLDCSARFAAEQGKLNPKHPLNATRAVITDPNCNEMLKALKNLAKNGL